MDYEYMGRQIRYARRSLDITQAKLAETVNVSASFIGHVERGSRKASLETIVKIGQALDLSLDRMILPEKIPH